MPHLPNDFSLFDGAYQGGYVMLVEVYEFCEAAPAQVGLADKITQLTNLHRVVGQARLVPLLPKDEEDDSLVLNPGVIDLVEEGGKGNVALQDVPLSFLRNVPGTSLLPEPETETMLADGPIRVGEDVWLMSEKRIWDEVINGREVSPERQAELMTKAQSVEDLRAQFPSGRYALLGIEIKKKGVYCRLQTPQRWEATILSEFLVPCNRPPRKGFST